MFQIVKNILQINLFFTVDEISTQLNACDSKGMKQHHHLYL
jgi:hypothetical protein